MEESLPPPDAEDSIFDQFDVQVTEELVPGGASIVDGYFCRLPPCLAEKEVFKSRRALIMHRLQVHSLPQTGTYEIPDGDQIRHWLRSGKPRPSQIPHRSPGHTKSRKCPAGPSGPSLLSKLLHCKPDKESELQPASLKSNIYEQFNVRHESGEAGGSPYVGFVCLLSQCHEEKVCMNTYAKWTRHRRSVHKETKEFQSVTLPDGYEIREWVILNKPRPFKVPVKRKAWMKGKLCPVDPAVFAEFDVMEDDEQRWFFCLLDPCKEQGVSFPGRRCWRKHRVKYHMSPKYEDGEYTLPSEVIITDWMNAGKPLHYKPRRRVRTFITVDPSAKTSTELDNQEESPKPSNVGIEVNGQKSQVLCSLPEGKESRKCRSENQQSQGHHQELHKLLSQEGRPSLRNSKSLARLGKFKPPTPPVEILRGSRRRGRRLRNVDAAGCSSDTEPAHQKKKIRQSIHVANRNHSTDITDSESSDLVALRVVARGEDPSGGLWKQFMEETNPTGDETPASDDSDEEWDEGTEDVDEESGDDGSENVDDLSVEQSEEDPNHDHNSADMEEFGEEPREDSARPENALPSLPYSQSELHDSGDVDEVDEDAHEEIKAPDNVSPSQPEFQNVTVVGHSSISQTQDFQGETDEHHKNSMAEMTKAGEEDSEGFEAPDNVLPSQPELQNIKVVGHSKVQPQDFQGVTDEHQQNSTAEMADEESLKDSVASENVLPSLQNSSKEAVEMGEVEEEEPEDYVAPENALTALTYSQPRSWEHSSVQCQDFQIDIFETPPNPTAEMNEVDEEAPDNSVAMKNVLSSLSCLQPEFDVTEIVEHDNVLPQEFPGNFLEMAKFGEAHEEFINPWKFKLSVPSDVSEQIALSPLRHLNGNTFQCLLQDFPGENKEDNLKYSAEMAEFGEKAPEEIVAVGNLIPSLQTESSEQNALSTLRHYFRDALQFSPKDSSGETDNFWQNSNAEMVQVGEEAPEGFMTPGNVVPWIPLVHSEGTKVPSLKGPIDIQAAPIQEFVPHFSMDHVFVIGPNDAGMAKVSEEAPEGFVTLESSAPWIPLMQGTKLPSLEGPIDIQAALIQETVPRVHMDPVFIEEPSATGMIEVGEEALAEFAAPGNLVPMLPSNAPHETGEQSYLSSLNTNASSLDYRNIENETIIHEFPWAAEFMIDMDIAFLNEPMVLGPSAPSTQPGGREIGSIFMEGSAENSTENQVDPIRKYTTLMDVGKAFESEPDLLPIDDRVENPEEFFRLEAVAHSPQPMQQVFSPVNSESSFSFPVFPLQQTDPLIDMNAGLEFELSMRLQADDIPAWLCSE